MPDPWEQTDRWLPDLHGWDGWAMKSDAANVSELVRLLERAADALHDAAWIMEGAKTEPPLPPPVAFVLPGTKALEDEIRAVLRGK